MQQKHAPRLQHITQLLFSWEKMLILGIPVPAFRWLRIAAGFFLQTDSLLRSITAQDLQMSGASLASILLPRHNLLLSLSLSLSLVGSFCTQKWKTSTLQDWNSSSDSWSNASSWDRMLRTPLSLYDRRLFSCQRIQLASMTKNYLKIPNDILQYDAGVFARFHPFSLFITCSSLHRRRP
jgi:hypothetical protein